MGTTHEFTLIANADYSDKLGCGIKVGTALVNGTPKGVLAGAGEAIDGIITDIMVGGAGAPLAVAKVGDIVFAKLGGTVTVGDDLATDANGAFVTQASTAVTVAKALASGVATELIPVLIK